MDVAAVVRDVVDLETMGDGEVRWRVQGADRPAWVMGRKDEMRDVLLNVFENARLAGARHVDVTVQEDDRRVTIETVDDGAGRSEEHTSELQSPCNLVCRLLLEKKKQNE